jgi:alkylation response protein AidB-like acyl-CoA dehydrogenase
VNFDLDDDQRDFAAAARDFFAEQSSPADARRALDEGTAAAPGRKALADIGFYGITVPESAGGAGQSVLDLAVVAEQGGRVLAGPSLVTAARVAVLLAGDDTRLAGLADGSVGYAVVDGTAPVLDAATADCFLARRGADLVIAEGTVALGEPIDPTRGLGTVTLGDTEVVATDIGVRWEQAERVARVILAAEDLGAAARAVEMAVAYAKERAAFGRFIGSYQAIKHLLVDAYVGVEQLRSLVWWAAWTADESPDELPLAAAAAKASAAGVLERAAETLIQVHGGIGFTWEHDAHLYWRRAKVDRFLLGDDVAAFDEVARIALASAPTDAPEPAPTALEPTTAG